METSFCGPAFIYIIISVLALILQYQFTTTITFGILLHIAFVVVWTIILYILCTRNWGNTAWFLVVLPFIIGYFMLQILLEKAILDPSILLQFGTPNPKVVATAATASATAASAASAATTPRITTPGISLRA
jgi:hypothetical protein